MNNKGFTLLETMLVTGILAFMAAAMLPATLKMLQMNDAKNVAKEITGIQEAERSYYINQMNANNGAGEWADSIQQLQQGGYIPADWNGNNIFGNTYTLTDNGNTLTVTTSLPSGLEGVIQADCMDVTASDTGLSNASVSSTIPVPAAEPALAGLVHRYGTGESRTATQSIGTSGCLMVGIPQGGNVDSNNITPLTNTNSETIPDIYDSALTQSINGAPPISPKGWLSQAVFPANIDPMQIDYSADENVYGIHLYLPTDFFVPSLYAYGTEDYIGQGNTTGNIGFIPYQPSIEQYCGPEIQGMNQFDSGNGTIWYGGTITYCTGQYNGKSISFTIQSDNYSYQIWTFGSNCTIISASAGGQASTAISGQTLYVSNYQQVPGGWSGEKVVPLISVVLAVN